MRRMFPLVFITMLCVVFGFSCEEGSDDDPTETDNNDETEGNDSTSRDLSGAHSCVYNTDFTTGNCFQYAASVTTEEAEADCLDHKQGGALPTSGQQFRESNCADMGDTSGYCTTAGQTPPGREYAPYAGNCADDCLAETNFSSAWGCETMGGGAYTCCCDSGSCFD